MEVTYLWPLWLSGSYHPRSRSSRTGSSPWPGACRQPTRPATPSAGASTAKGESAITCRPPLNALKDTAAHTIIVLAVIEHVRMDMGLNASVAREQASTRRRLPSAPPPTSGASCLRSGRGSSARCRTASSARAGAPSTSSGPSGTASDAHSTHCASSNNLSTRHSWYRVECGDSEGDVNTIVFYKMKTGCT